MDQGHQVLPQSVDAVSAAPAPRVVPNHAYTGPPPAEQVRQQLERILGSPDFARSERPKRFLRFLVEQVLEGRSDRLNEYDLAVEIFNRRGFRPDSDPIVRAEAGRLRRRLQRYYEREGALDAVLIGLPPRTYQPVFQARLSRGSGLRARMQPRWIWSALAVVGALLLALTLFVALGRTAKPRGAAGPAGETGLTKTPPQSAPSIAVLPFLDLSPNNDEEYFCDGLTEEVIDALTKVQGLRVVSRTSAFFYKEKSEDIRKIATQLNARLVLSGSVQKSGNRLRVIAELVDATNGYNLWSRTYERELKDVFEIEREIAIGIVNTLRTQLAGARWLRPLEQYAPKLDAYTSYLTGLHFARWWTADGFQKSVMHFERAIALDPKFAPASAQLAEVYVNLAEDAGLPPQEVMRRARAAALNALALDATLPDPHAALGLLNAFYEWDWTGAERELRWAHELDPSDAGGHVAYVRGFLAPTGRLDDALREIREADGLDPISPRVDVTLSTVYYFRRQYGAALAELRRPLALDPQFHPAHLALATVYQQQSRSAEAIAAGWSAEAVSQSPAGKSYLGYALAHAGRKSEAQKLIEELAHLSTRRYVSPAHPALIWLGLGDNGRALKLLEEACEQRSAAVVYLKVDPRFDPLRAEPRFKALLKRIHLD